jgi:hypothetical protein
MEKRVVYKITFLEGGQSIQTIQIDELNAVLIWNLYKESGFIRTEQTKFLVEESFEEA